MKASVVQAGMKAIVDLDKKEIDKKRNELEIETQKKNQKTQSIKEKFGESTLDKIEEEFIFIFNRFKNNTVGLVTKEEFSKKR